MIEMAVYY